MTPADLQAAASALHVLRPTWLWCLLLVPLLAWWQRRHRRRDSVWRVSVDAHLLPHLLDTRGGARTNVAPWLLLAAFTLGVVALAGPSWRQVEQPLLQNDAPLVVAVDLSSRSLADDLPPSRLLQARSKIGTLLKERRGGQVGLVAFADDAYTVAPLTDDTANVALFLDALSPDVMPVDGSNAARAIALSATLLKQAGFTSGDILVVGDHADSAARNAAAQALRDGYRVSALGAGTATGAAYRTPRGDIAHAALDAASLQGIASSGGGRYAALRADDGDLASLGVLDAGSAETSAARGDRIGVWQDDGYWLLLPAMLLALFAFRRGSGMAVVLVCAWLPLQPARAAGGDGTLWRRADQVEQSRMQSGADAYRKGAFDAAAQAWKAIPGADADYNSGNALAKAGRYEDAIAAYDDALRKQPAMADARANKVAVQQAMKRRPPPSPSKNGGNDKQQGKRGKPQDGQSNPRDSQSGQSQSGQQQGDTPPRAKPSQQQGTPPQHDAPPPRDAEGKDAQGEPAKAPDANAAKTQRDADAQQRARMQQALQRNAQGGQQAKEAGKAATQAGPRETAQAREQRQATEAWLRRVPDDPGGLLRAKFRLEYERRENTGER